MEQFVVEQNAFSSQILDKLPGRERFHQLTSSLLRAPTRGCPLIRGDRYFAWHNDGTNQDVLVVADSLEELENGRVLIDPNLLSADGTVAVTSAAVSPDGSLVAYATSSGGSDWRTIGIRDVATGEDLPEQIKWAKWNDPVWLPDGRSFSYWAYEAPAGSALTDRQGAGRLLCHVVGTEVSADTVLFENPQNPKSFVYHGPRDDNWFILSCSDGSADGNDLGVRTWSEPAKVHHQLVSGLEYQWDAVAVRRGMLYVLTNESAPKYRLAVFNLVTGEQHTLVAEHDTDVLLGAALTSSTLVLWYSSDASHRMQLFYLDGVAGDPVPLGTGISITKVETNATSDEFFVTTTSFVDRGTRHLVSVASSALREIETLPTPGQEPIAAITSRIRATSSDGTQVPAFLVHRDDTALPGPTLIWAYGGFNISMNPEFRPLLAAWVAAGGILVVPNLRGGGEFGSDWHRAGTKENKQNVFNDLYATAEELIASGVTTSTRLALHGRSNGGLLAGVALTQRPELWAAVLPGVGVLDMLRFHLFTIGWAWVNDYGDPEDEQAARYLAAYSPLHNVRVGTSYPPTLITTGDHDDRVVPAHSYKFCAALQSAQAGPGPILLKVDTQAGHGAGKPKDAQADEFAYQLAFAAHFTGLDPNGSTPPLPTSPASVTLRM